MNKKLVIIISVIVLVIGIGVVSAQGRGNGGNGNSGSRGSANVICDPQNPDSCLSDPQVNAYTYGGVGFVNPQTGAQWNGQQRGAMGRETGMNGTGLYASLPPAYDGVLPQEVIDLMVDGWTDEQHAYAVYESVMAQFGEVAPFVSIQKAEVQHSAAWEFLFDRYGIATPAVPSFEVPAFATTADACAVAAAAEIANFELYDTMMTAFADYPDIYQIALALRNASEFNHLPAFEACAS